MNGTCLYRNMPRAVSVTGGPERVGRAHHTLAGQPLTPQLALAETGFMLATQTKLVVLVTPLAQWGAERVNLSVQVGRGCSRKVQLEHLPGKAYFSRTGGLCRDVRAAVDLCHRDGSLKREVAENPAKYIHEVRQNPASPSHACKAGCRRAGCTTVNTAHKACKCALEACRPELQMLQVILMHRAWPDVAVYASKQTDRQMSVCPPARDVPSLHTAWCVGQAWWLLPGRLARLTGHRALSGVF